MPPSPYQRILLNGVPVWKDSEGKLYYYDTQTPPTTDTRICIGTETTGLSSDWQTTLQDRLTSYRTTLTSRSRAAK